MAGIEIKGIGNLGAEPALKYVGEDDKPVCELRVYLVSGKKDKDGEWIDRGMWVDVSVWGSCSEPSARLFGKGDRIYLEGTLGIDRWDNSEGEPKSRPVIDANLALPWLPSLESIAYKPRKGEVNNEDEADED